MTKDSPSIPPEIWDTIFDYLSTSSIYQCQRVCKTWYPPARRALLQHVELSSRYELLEFLRCMQAGNHASDFQAVKRITIGDSYIKPSRSALLLQSEALKTLIKYFPNIQELTIDAHYSEMTNFTQQNIISAMKQHWPLLKAFKISHILLSSEHTKIYLEIMYSLREQMTVLTLYDSEWIIEEVGSAEEFVASFPQLVHLKIIPQNRFENLYDHLYILEKCSNLRSLDLYTKKEDDALFMEKYTQQNSRERQILLEERLAAIKTLKLTMTYFCINTVKFITQYFVGLQKITFGFVRSAMNAWTEEQKDIFAGDFLSFVFERENYHLQPLVIAYKEDDIYFAKIMETHSSVAHKKQVTIHIHIILFNNSPHFGLEYNNTAANYSKFTLEMFSNRSQRTAQLSHYYSKKNTHSLLDSLKEVLSSKEVTSLTFDVAGMHIETESVPQLFCQMMQWLPKATKVVIVWPRNDFSDNSFTWPEETTMCYPQVTCLKLLSSHPSSRVDISTLPSVSGSFPCLKYLSLENMSGYWHESSKAFLINLPQSKLERLHLDVTPIRIWMDTIMKKPVAYTDAFFILKVTMLNHVGTNRMYQWFHVSMDYLRITKLEKNELQEGDYVGMHLVIKEVKFINFYLNRVYSEEIGNNGPTLPTSFDHRNRAQASISIFQ